jgi:hypothetical protein
MLISMPTGISTIFGAFQDILELLDFSAKPRLSDSGAIRDSTDRPAFTESNMGKACFPIFRRRARFVPKARPDHSAGVI